MGIFMQKPSTVQPCSQDFGPWVAKPPDERSESIASEAHEACRALGRRTVGVTLTMAATMASPLRAPRASVAEVRGQSPRKFFRDIQGC